MPTPSERRGSNTLRGSGWLREAPANLVPADWLKIRGRVALRQCIFLPGPDASTFAEYERERERRASLVAPAAAPPRKKAFEDPASVRRMDEMRQAHIFPAFVDRRARDRHESGHGSGAPAGAPDRARVARVAGGARSSTGAHAPGVPAGALKMGLLLLVAPPVGLAMLWSSPVYDRDARWALTFSSLFCVALATALIAALAR